MSIYASKELRRRIAASRRRVAKRCKKLGEKDASTYRRIIVALWAEAEDDVRNFCHNYELAESAGVNQRHITRFLDYAILDGLITVYTRLCVRRVIVLMDHPRSQRDCRMFEWNQGERREPVKS